MLELTSQNELKDQDVEIQVSNLTESQPSDQNNTQVSANASRPSPVPTVVPFVELLSKPESYVHF